MCIVILPTQTKYNPHNVIEMPLYSLKEYWNKGEILAQSSLMKLLTPKNRYSKKLDDVKLIKATYSKFQLLITHHQQQLIVQRSSHVDW
jgi:hypothetical protein